MRKTWTSPDAKKEDNKLIKELQLANRQLKEEVNRKKDLIQNLKSQKDNHL